MTSIIVPCFNEEKNIALLARRFADVKTEEEIELILVNNGSTDNTEEAIDDEIRDAYWIKKVNVPVNRGYGYGILQGLKAATGDRLGWIHADLQSEPETFLPMIRMAKDLEGDFLIKGVRKSRSAADNFFTVGMGLFESCLFRRSLFDVNSQPTLLSKRFYESWKEPPEDFALDLYVYALALKREIPVLRVNSPQHKRANGESSWNKNFLSRYNMVKRVMAYSLETKRRIEKEI